MVTQALLSFCFRSHHVHQRYLLLGLELGSGVATEPESLLERFGTRGWWETGVNTLIEGTGTRQ